MPQPNPHVKNSGRTARPSRFLVDLPGLLEAEAAKEPDWKERTGLNLAKLFKKKEEASRAKHQPRRPVFDWRTETVRRLFLVAILSGLFRLLLGLIRIIYRIIVLVVKAFLFIFRYIVPLWPLAGLFFRILKPKRQDLAEKGGTDIVNEEDGPDPAETSWGFRPFRALKPLFIFTAISFLAVIPVKMVGQLNRMASADGRIMGMTESAIENIAAAGQAVMDRDFSAADRRFNQAKIQFTKAQDEIKWLTAIAATANSILPNDKLELAVQANRLIRAGEIGAEAGITFTKVFESAAKEESSFGQAFALLLAELPGLESANNELQGIIYGIKPEIFPEQYRESVSLAKDRGMALTASLDELVELAALFKDILGYEYDSRFLLVFQNNSELRGGGGFVGSYALADFRDGEIKNLEVPEGGGYDTEAGMYSYIKAPEPLRLVNPRWYFWDANWWPDWPMSAQKLAWFLEESSGPSVDGVIGITTTVMEELLAVIGPIEIPEYADTRINSRNFWPIVQTIVENKPPAAVNAATGTPDQAATGTPAKQAPKRIIGDMMEIMLEEIPKRLEYDGFITLAQTCLDLINRKHILLYFTDKENQSLVARYKWGAAMEQAEHDYLLVVNSNIAGQKTDRAIKQSLNLETAAGTDHRMINTLTITRRHNGIKGDAFTGVRNVNWLRVYVPEGSRLISASGFNRPAEEFFGQPEDFWQDDPDIAAGEGKAARSPAGPLVYSELGKTVFAGWSMLDPGQTAVITLSYELPFKLSDFRPEEARYQYSLLAQKQPGDVGTVLYYNLDLPEGYRIVNNDGAWIEAENGYSTRRKLDRDAYFEVLMNDL